MGQRILETERLVLRELDEGDAPFVVELLNDADWRRYIGDRGVSSLEDARGWLRRGPIALQARHGYSLWGMELRDGGELAGICGLVRRPSLDAPDLGFATLARWRARGLALEAARATLAHARDVLGLARVVALVHPANDRSARLLEKLGMRHDSLIELEGGVTTRLFVPGSELGVPRSGRPSGG